jgi:predicted RNase H-like nuclease (RuvC/YqgF family)
LDSEKKQLEKELENTIDRANEMFEKQNAVIEKLQNDNKELKAIIKQLKKKLKGKK